MANDFGAHLKHEREMRGITLDEVSQATKIHMRYLVALENNDFDQLPGEVFIKGFIRSYSKVIGADVEELLAFYDDNAGRERRDKAQQDWEDAGETQRREQLKVVNTLLGGFLAVFLLVGIFFLIRMEPEPVPDTPSNRVTSNKRPQQMQPAPSETAEMETPVNEESEAINDESTTTQNMDSESAETNAETEEPENSIPKIKNGVIIQGQQNQTASNVSAPENETDRKPGQESIREDTQADRQEESDDVALDLEIRVRENGWFNLIVDGTRQQDFILPAGSSKRFQASDSIKITLGNRRGTELALNGKALSLPAGRDNVVRDFLINSKQVQ